MLPVLTYVACTGLTIHSVGAYSTCQIYIIEHEVLFSVTEDTEVRMMDQQNWRSIYTVYVQIGVWCPLSNYWLATILAFMVVITRNLHWRCSPGTAANHRHRPYMSVLPPSLSAHLAVTTPQRTTARKRSGAHQAYRCCCHFPTWVEVCGRGWRYVVGGVRCIVGGVEGCGRGGGLWWVGVGV